MSDEDLIADTFKGSAYVAPEARKSWLIEGVRQLVGRTRRLERDRVLDLIDARFGRDVNCNEILNGLREDVAKGVQC